MKIESYTVMTLILVMFEFSHDLLQIWLGARKKEFISNSKNAKQQLPCDLTKYIRHSNISNLVGNNNTKQDVALASCFYHAHRRECSAKYLLWKILHNERQICLVTKQ